MSNAEFLEYSNREVKKIIEKLDIATVKEIMKFEMIPEIELELQKSRECRDPHKRLIMSMNILKKAYQLCKRRCK